MPRLGRVVSIFVAVGLTAAGLVASFALVRAMPGDAAEIRAAAMGGASGATVEALRAMLGSDLGLGEQILRFVGQAMRGDLGRSWASDRPILPELAARLPWSLAIGLGGLALGLAAGFALGLAAAGGSRIGAAASRAVATAAQTLPAFGVGLLLVWAFAVELGWLRPFTGGLAEMLCLPVLTVAFFVAGPAARIAAASFEDARAAPWFVAARAKGLSEQAVILRHAAPHAALALLAGASPELAWVVGGAAVTEVVFATPGLGVWVVEAVAARDHAVLQVYLALVLGWMAAAHGLVRLARRRLDPRPAALR